MKYKLCPYVVLLVFFAFVLFGAGKIQAASESASDTQENSEYYHIAKMLSKVYTIAQKFKSMKGPQSTQEIFLL